MKPYQYQRADGRTSTQQFSNDATALRFLQELGDNWQLLTPICDAQPLPAPLAHVEPTEQMREAALWVQGGLELMAAGSLFAAKEAFRTAYGRLTGTEPARDHSPVGIIAIAQACTGCTNGNCSTPPPAYGQPDAQGHNQAAADHGFAS
ncbi:hypothetical protein [Hymenobacter metallilatus]|uniref:Uncharacterized protein n=1 Tax=Hymenobacter metallilatus TaxID=2493666 RepID=A0A428JCM2_9BACT|nr:hypothetical protein [Hymenobacter metallilatus]RSK29867.1 hypothetical protein EI290_16155 [Hymenobacter metallilatus]